MLPSIFDNMFNNADNREYNTRFATNFDVPNNKLELGNKYIYQLSRCQHLE